MIKDDHEDQHDDPLHLLGIRHLAAVIASVVLAAGGVIQLLLTLALDMRGTHLWGLGLACLISATIVGVYAGILDVRRLEMRTQISNARELAAHMERAADREAEMLQCINRLEQRQSGILGSLEQTAVRLTQIERHSQDIAQEITDELEAIQGRVERLAGTVGNVLADDLSKRRRSG